MRHLKRPALLGLLLLACLLLAGFRMDSTMEELFTLPRLPTEYTTLSRQLDQLLSEGYEYMAPTSGRNIQSLQMVDIDGDGRDEALAFFRLSNGEKPLKIYVFHSREDSYELASIIESSGTAIDSIYYEDLTGDGRKELIVGWKISSDVQTVTVYDMRPGPVQLMQSNYTRLSFQELNGDGIPSLLLLRTNIDNQPVAEFCSWQDGSLSVSHRCTLSSTMAELNQGSVITGKLDQDTPAVFITGINSQGPTALSPTPSRPTAWSFGSSTGPTALPPWSAPITACPAAGTLSCRRIGRARSPLSPRTPVSVRRR